MTRIPILTIATLLAVVSVATGQEPTIDALEALEARLHGNWRGGPCVGQFVFNADGTYERRHYSPANISSTGRWSLHWDALPPTLTLNCQTSDDQDEVGKPFQYKLTRLDDTFAIQFENAREPLVYYRDNESHSCTMSSATPAGSRNCCMT